MNFIEIYKNSVSGDVCDKLIALFEKYDYLHVRGVTSIGVDETYKKSTEITITEEFMGDEEWNAPLKEVLSSLQDNLKNYKLKYSEYENNVPLLGIDALQYWGIDSVFNFQRYLPGEGYYAWHCEVPGKSPSKRMLAWMIYLNDVSDNGGTEFKFQNYISNAEQGKLLVWPAYWTHFHRGIPSKTESKYILTGWFSFK